MTTLATLLSDNLKQHHGLFFLQNQDSSAKFPFRYKETALPYNDIVVHGFAPIIDPTGKYRCMVYIVSGIDVAKIFQQQKEEQHAQLVL